MKRSDRDVECRNRPIRLSADPLGGRLRTSRALPAHAQGQARLRLPLSRGPERAMSKLKLISHKLCPYVQRAVIALTEKGVPFERIDVDLASKPDWFVKISPLGKTPVLLV